MEIFLLLSLDISPWQLDLNITGAGNVKLESSLGKTKSPDRMGGNVYLKGSRRHSPCSRTRSGPSGLLRPLLQPLQYVTLANPSG